MLEGGIRDGNRLFEVNRCATISPQEPASVNRLRQFSSESFPPRKWQILAFLVVFLSWRSPRAPARAEPSCRERGAALPAGRFAPSRCKHAAAAPLGARAGRESPGGARTLPAAAARRSAKGSQPRPGLAEHGGGVWQSLTHGGKGKKARSLYYLLKDSRRPRGHPKLSSEVRMSLSTSCSVLVAFRSTVPQCQGFATLIPREDPVGCAWMTCSKSKGSGQAEVCHCCGLQACARLPPASSSSLPGGGAGDTAALSESLLKSCFSISLPLEEGLTYPESSSYGGDRAPRRLGQQPAATAL